MCCFPPVVAQVPQIYVNCRQSCLHRPSHGLSTRPRSHARRIHPFYEGSAWVLLIVLKYFRRFHMMHSSSTDQQYWVSTGYSADTWCSSLATCWTSVTCDMSTLVLPVSVYVLVYVYMCSFALLAGGRIYHPPNLVLPSGSTTQTVCECQER